MPDFKSWLATVDPTVKKETAYIASVTGILSLFLQAGFLIAMHWDYTVLMGNLIGGVTAVGNFFLMGLTVQKAVAKEKKSASDLMKFSQTARLLMQVIIVVLGFVVPFFNPYAVLIPLFFPRIAIMIRPFLDKKKSDN